MCGVGIPLNRYGQRQWAAREAHSTFGFGAQTTDGKQVRNTPVFGRRTSSQVSARNLQNWAQKLFEVELCGTGGAERTIIAPRHQEQSGEQFGSGGKRRWSDRSVQWPKSCKILHATCMQSAEIRPTDSATMKGIASSDQSEILYKTSTQ